MTVFLAGMRATADRMNDHTLEDSTASGLTPGTDFTVNTFSGRKVSGITTVHCYLLYTGAGLNVSPDPGGNLGDVTMCTLPAGWRPPETINAIIGDGVQDGECTISSAGVVSLRSVFSSIENGRNIRMTAVWISENG
ncbi:hypothetical protein GA0115233_100915 [Streptomyces sp. DI166]|uniref:hypothetical protein n=1 Tax=Streptomyces sp. DI166 TaxID=1839783 RepID=UPI0007F389B9|nr:hypothetical protein [Streptomyces sp. DI166]SBT89368.1 hypothetical protein GA0115233_100915 [Streptomyces sp. DI166]